MPHRWAECSGGKLEIIERAPDKYSSSMHSAIWRFLSIDEQYLDSALGEDAGTLQAGKSGPHNDHVVIVIHINF
jgi:hypothetical protein